MRIRRVSLGCFTTGPHLTVHDTAPASINTGTVTGIRTGAGIRIRTEKRHYKDKCTIMYCWAYFDCMSVLCDKLSQQMMSHLVRQLNHNITR